MDNSRKNGRNMALPQTKCNRTIYNTYNRSPRYNRVSTSLDNLSHILCLCKDSTISSAVARKLEN